MIDVNNELYILLYCIVLYIKLCDIVSGDHALNSYLLKYMLAVVL